VTRFDAVQVGAAQLDQLIRALAMAARLAANGQEVRRNAYLLR
jgi:hypothetical protein